MQGRDRSAVSILRRLRPLWGRPLPLLLALMVLPAAMANTSLFTDSRTCSLNSPGFCTELSWYGVLVGTTNDTLNLNGNWTIDGGIAVGTTSNLNRGSASSSNTANGIVDFADALNINAGGCSGAHNICGNGTLNGTSPVTNVRVSDAVTALDNIMTVLAGATFDTGNGSQTTLPKLGVLDVTAGLGGGTLKVYRNTAAYTQTGALTLGCGGAPCSPDMLVVIKATANFNLKYDLILADGLTADQVVFYLPTNALTMNPTVGSISVAADFILGAANATLANGSWGVTLTGRVFNDNGNINFGASGGFQDDQGFIPEPTTWATFAGGVLLLVWKRGRFSRKH